MFEFDKLSEIINDYDSLKNAVNNSIDNKLFIHNGLKHPIRKLPEKEILYGINSLMKHMERDYVCLSIIDIIEWTPIKLFQTAYFMVKLYDKFWIVRKDMYKCNVVGVINMIDYIKYIYNIGIKEKTNYINNKCYPVFSKFRAALKPTEKDDYALIEQVSYESNVKINHYLYKYNKVTYYIAVYHDNNDYTYIFAPTIFNSSR
jgi:hypothetical protein